LFLALPACLAYWEKKFQAELPVLAADSCIRSRRKSLMDVGSTPQNHYRSLSSLCPENSYLSFKIQVKCDLFWDVTSFHILSPQGRANNFLHQALWPLCPCYNETSSSVLFCFVWLFFFPHKLHDLSVEMSLSHRGILTHSTIHLICVY
jgi:hypothetical protein